MNAPPLKAQTPGGSPGSAEESKQAPIIALSSEERKRFATLQARAALGGVTLHLIDGDDGKPVFILTRWHLTRDLRTLDEVDAWLDRVTGVRA